MLKWERGTALSEIQVTNTKPIFDGQAVTSANPRGILGGSEVDPRERPYLTVLVPVYNEEDNIPMLFRALLPVLDGLPYTFEIIAINDGSADKSLDRLCEAARERPEVKIIDFRRNFGQTAAMMAGFDHAAGEVIVSIDADLQNDPTDIPQLISVLDQGYDVVSGWRKERKDAPIRRTLISRIANWIISLISGVRLRDYGCTLKAYRREVVRGARLYGEMHRFIPIYAAWMGAKVTELPVQHHPRKFGKSKCGLERIFKVTLDLIVIKFLDKYLVKPIYIFGGFAIGSFAVSLLAFSYMLYLKFADGLSMILTPLPLVVALSFMVGVMCILMGLLAEILVRTYFESQGRAAYVVRRTLNFHGDK